MAKAVDAIIIIIIIINDIFSFSWSMRRRQKGDVPATIAIDLNTE